MLPYAFNQLRQAAMNFQQQQQQQQQLAHSGPGSQPSSNSPSSTTASSTTPQPPQQSHQTPAGPPPPYPNLDPTLLAAYRPFGNGTQEPPQPAAGRFIHEEPKPQHSYIGLIAMGILSSGEQKMVLSDIYQWILDNYPYFRSRGPGWRNSIRHNLSLNDCFIKSGRSANGKGHYWAIHPANMDDFRRGDFRRRRAQRKVRKHMGLSVPDEDEDSDDSPPPSPHTLCNNGFTMGFGNHAQAMAAAALTESILANVIGQQQQQQQHQAGFPPTGNGNKQQQISPSNSSSDGSSSTNVPDHQHHHQSHLQNLPPPPKKRMFDMESLLAPDHANSVIPFLSPSMVAPESPLFNKGHKTASALHNNPLLQPFAAALPPKFNPANFWPFGIPGGWPLMAGGMIGGGGGGGIGGGGGGLLGGGLGSTMTVINNNGSSSSNHGSPTCSKSGSPPHHQQQQQMSSSTTAQSSSSSSSSNDNSPTMNNGTNAVHKCAGPTGHVLMADGDGGGGGGAVVDRDRTSSAGSPASTNAAAQWEETFAKIMARSYGGGGKGSHSNNSNKAVSATNNNHNNSSNNRD